MKDRIRLLMEKEGISLFGVIGADRVPLLKPHLLSRAALSPRAYLIYAVPYFRGEGENLSAYATSRDYHLFLGEFGKSLCAFLESALPHRRFLSFGDHSPIDERRGAALAGLGVLGRNGLLITKDYSSFVFLGEVATDADPAELGGETVFDIASCEGCGKCLAACPTGILRGEGDVCLSALTQKKGELTQEEKALLRRCGTAWGCDACQTACPHTKNAIRSGSALSPIPFFEKDRITRLSSPLLEGMSEEDFRERAFAWRGRETVLRNVKILEEP